MIIEKKPVEQGILDRVVQGVKYIIQGNKGNLWFSPGDPIAPQAQTKEGVPGRAFDFPMSVNIRRTPRDGEGVTFEHMRSLADGYDLMRLVIETRKDQMEKLSWVIKPRKEVEQAAKEAERIDAAKKHVDKVKAKNDKLGQPPKLAPDGVTPLPEPADVPEVPEPKPVDPKIKEISDFLMFPDGEHEWKTWLRALLEDMLVLDAATLYPRSTLGGDLYALELVDGATIKRIIDESGRTPEPPSVAYQQVLKGIPAVDYSRDELIYRPRNVRTNRVYGYSPVEQIIMTVNIALRRQMGQLQYYTEGNIPEAFIGVPPEWNPDQIAQFQEYWDGILEGNTAQRRKAKFVPGGMDVHETKDPALTDKYDEWLARIICFAFSVSPQALIAQMNRATAETADAQAKKEGLEPVMNWVKGLMDYVIWKYFGYTDYEFAWDEEEETAPLVQMQVLTGYVLQKVMTTDEAREKLGLPALTSEQKEALTPPAPVLPLGGNGPPGSQGGSKPPGGDGPVLGNPQPAAGGTGKPVGKTQSSGLRKASSLSRDRASVKTCTSGITKLVKPALAKAGARVGKLLADKLAKGISADDQAKKLIAALTFDELKDLAPELAEMLEDMAADGGAEALAQVISEVTKEQLDQVNKRAVEYSKARSAELVTNLEQSTRDMLRATVTQGIEEGWSNDKLAGEIEDSYAFDPARAETIARTETAYADIQGNLDGYRASGVVQGKQWIIAQDEFCDECNELDGVVVGLDEQFPGDGGDGPPLHPNCRCDILPVLTEETP
jgi:SPP1 gp7 family putative phage head morphogenesis protein